MNLSDPSNGETNYRLLYLSRITMSLFTSALTVPLLLSAAVAFAAPPDPIAPLPGSGFMYIGPNPSHLLDGTIPSPKSTVSGDSILSVATPSAECTANLNANFELLKRAATNELTPRDRPQMETVRMQIVRFKDPIRAGNTNYARKVISLDVGLCDKSEINRQGVIAHELGHMISIFRSKEAARIVADELQYPNVTFSQNEPTMEAYANQYGAQIMRGAGISSAQWLAVIDKECRNGSQYFCREADNWRGGLTY